MKIPFKKTENKPRRRATKSSSVAVNKYISPRKRDAGKVENKRKSHKRRRAIVRVAVFAVVIIISAAFFWSNSRITVVSSSTEHQKYQVYVGEYITRNPVSNFKTLISSQAIEEKVLSEFPEVKALTMVMPFFGNSIYINVELREAQLVLQSDSNYYIVDQNGYAYDTYSPEKPLLNAVILKDDTEVNYSLQDNRFVASKLVEFIESSEEIINKQEIFKEQDTSYRITDEARVLFLKPSKQKYEVKLQLDRPVEVQLANLSSALKYFKEKSINPNSYVDVRINGTVYYK